MIAPLVAAVRALRWRWWALKTGARLRRLGGRLVLEASGTPRLLGALHVDVDGRAGTLTLRIGRDVSIGRDCVIDLAPGADGTIELGDRVVLQSRVRLQPWGGAIRLGAGAQIRDACELKSKGELRLGERSICGRTVTLHCHTAITLGDCVGLAERVTIADSDHANDGSDTFFMEQPVLAEPVVLERNVFCGTNAVVLRGAWIGCNAVVAAGAVVTSGEHPPGWLIAGVPATPIKRLPAAPRMIRLFHCDDSDAMRLLVREQFAEHPRVEIIGWAADPDGAVAGAAEAQPDVVLLDLLDPENADRLVAELRRVAPGARIVVYSGYPADTARLGHGGADGYVEKSAPFDVLERAIVG